jgi:UDP-N-acetylmuramyl pentapeptide phosphotransferase/UDP-N-acetylglucosamine-1-phosphate transferase
MTAGSMLAAAAVAVTAFLAGAAYRILWLRAGRIDTPTGFGVFFAPSILAVLMSAGASLFLVAAMALISASTVIYWFDDLVQLSARFRMALAFFTGGVVALLVLWTETGLPFWLLACGVLGAGILNVVLTNIVNFYDGADLNLATFIALTAALMIGFGNALETAGTIGLGVLAFIVPFATFNWRPKMLYLGDAGSFAFATLLTLAAVTYLAGSPFPTYAAIPLTLPAVDTGFVFCLRIAQGQDLMTRNYLHLYQKLAEHRGGFAYLLPQMANCVLLLAGVLLLEKAGVPSPLAIGLGAVVLTIPFYIVCRKLFVRHVPPHEGAA